MIYLDYNASTPVDPKVAETICEATKEVYGNPSSIHEIGVSARRLMEDARFKVADLIGASPEEIIFTSGGTESNNLALMGLVLGKRQGHVIASCIEHPSVMNACKYIARMGFDVTYVGVDREGRVDPEEVRNALRYDTFLITIMHANNETGVIQPVEEIGTLARERGIRSHTDAAQTIGKIPVNVKRLSADMVTIVSHKFYGPKGVGALYIRRGTRVDPILYGAGHEQGLRPGTENVPGIAGLGKACELAASDTGRCASEMKRLTRMLFDGLRERIGVGLNGHEILRLPNTLNLRFPGIDAAGLLERLHDKIAASAGSACHSGSRQPSSVLLAMGLSDADALSSLRLSVGKFTREEEIGEAVRLLANEVRGRGR